MEKKIKNKYFIWAIVIFGTLGVTVPIIIRILVKEEDVFQLNEIVLNLSTYAVALSAGEVYKGLLRDSSSDLNFKSKLFDYIGIIVGAILYLIVLNFILSLSSFYVYFSAPIALAGCISSWYLWHKTNHESGFGTGALGH